MENPIYSLAVRFSVWVSSSYIVFLFILTVATSPVSAQKFAQKSKKKAKAQIAIVQVEGAAVYKFPNFDAPVIEYLRAGSKVIATLTPRQGIGGFGAFYRVRLKNKTLGWMTDVDLLPQYKKSDRPSKEVEQNPEYKKIEKKAKDSQREPIYFSKFVGGHVGLVQFTEKFDGRELSSDSILFGVRAIGPGLLFDGPPFDFSFSFSLEAPDHYKEFANGPATGFFMMADMLMPFPIIDGTNGMLTLGLGPMVTYTNFQLRIRTSAFDSQELRLGLVSSLAYMQRFGTFAMRFEGRYYFEKTEYFGGFLSFLFSRE